MAILSRPDPAPPHPPNARAPPIREGSTALIPQHNPNHHDELLLPCEVARLFRVDPKTVTRWAKQGHLASITTLGGHRRYYRSEIEKLLSHTPTEEETDGT